MKGLCIVAVPGSGCLCFYSSCVNALLAYPVPFTSDFHEPCPPQIVPEFKANWMQHKWNDNVSHIASGFIYISPSQSKIRADEASYGMFGSSLFDLTKTTNDGVLNSLWTLSPSINSTPAIWTGYVQPGFQILPAHILIESNAVYAGAVFDRYAGQVVTWNFMYSGVPVTALVEEQGILRGYDFWATNESTFVITRFFNIIVGKIGPEVFDFPASA